MNDSLQDNKVATLKVDDPVSDDDESDVENDGQELSLVINALQTSVAKKPLSSGQDRSIQASTGEEPKEASPTPVLYEEPPSPIPQATTLQDVSPPSPGTPPPLTLENERISDDDFGVDSNANLISVNTIDLKQVLPNQLSPRQQEKAGTNQANKRVKGRLADLHL